MPTDRRIHSITDLSETAAGVVARAALLGTTTMTALINDEPATVVQSIQARFALIGPVTQRAEYIAGNADLRDADVLGERDLQALAAVVASSSPGLLIFGSLRPCWGSCDDIANA